MAEIKRITPIVISVERCEHLQNSKYDCSNLYNCCDCGGNNCGCAYCFSCNACEFCLDENN